MIALPDKRSTRRSWHRLQTAAWFDAASCAWSADSAANHHPEAADGGRPTQPLEDPGAAQATSGRHCDGDAEGVQQGGRERETGPEGVDFHPELMGWIPPPDGIAMCQGDVG